MELNLVPPGLDNARLAIARARRERAEIERSGAEEDHPLGCLRILRAAAARSYAPNSRGHLAPLTIGARFTLEGLAGYTDPDGNTYVSVRALARADGRSESQVSREVAALVHAGLVVRRSRPDIGDRRRRILHLPLMVRPW